MGDDPIKLSELFVLRVLQSIGSHAREHELRGALKERFVLDAEATVQARCMLDPDFKEGYTAFLEKRQPKFR